MYTGRYIVNHMRHTHSQSAQRRSHHALTSVRLTLCESCGAPKMNHRVCTNCGKYDKREVLNVYKALDKKTKKTKEASTAKTPDKIEKVAKVKEKKVAEVKSEKRLEK